jgi:hypothetical protein
MKAEEVSGIYSTYGGVEKFIQNSYRKYEVERPHRRPRCKWEANRKQILRNRAVGCGVDLLALDSG